MEQPPTAFGAATEAIQAFAPASSTTRYVIYALVVGIAITIVVLIVDYYIPFIPTGPSAAARAGKTFWTTVTADSENLIVPVAESPTVQATQYSVALQLIIADSRTSGLGKYRHILHRGANPIGLPTTTPSGPTGHAGIQPTDVPKGPYTELGLPQIMNPGVFLDQYKNDIHVFVHTKGNEENMEVLWLESQTISDLPLNTPLNLGIVCTGKSLDIYLNCRLYSSMLLKGVPYLPKAENQWFGRYGAYPFTGLVKRLTLWDSPLGVSDMVQICRSPDFDLSDLPQGTPSCPAPVNTPHQ